jgi:hypothetical protein
VSGDDGDGGGSGSHGSGVGGGGGGGGSDDDYDNNNHEYMLKEITMTWARAENCSHQPSAGAELESVVMT